MRIGVVSDSHKDIDALIYAVKEMGHIELLLHAGDMYSDADKLAASLKDIKLLAVTGNCDFVHEPEEQVITIGGIKILLTHGHRLGVKWGLQRLAYTAEEKGVKAVIFGHTHIPYNHYWHDILLFNPGSVSQPRGNSLSSYGIIQVEGGNIDASIYSLINRGHSCP